MEGSSSSVLWVIISLRENKGNISSPLGRREALHGVVEHNVLTGQLQQHRVVKELVNRHIL